jgi:MoaA/NifB/PqqE/SkfB family radical SAM enzyme
MDKPFCSLPWGGIHINQELDVFFCCLMASPENTLGNLRDQTLPEILNSDAAREVRQEFLDGVIPKRCKRACGTRTGNIVNDFTAEEQQLVVETNQLEPTDLHAADIRSSNLCTLDCVYCNPLWSSTIAKREGLDHLIPTAENQRSYQQYISNIDIINCRRLFLAGGEPLLMKEYTGILNKIIDHNPECKIDVNTGLSIIDTPVFELLKKIKNVSWIVSVDTTDPDKFAYIRHGNTWNNFLNNLNVIKSIPGHGITAHMVYFALSYKNFDVSYKHLVSLGLNILVDPVYHNAISITNVPHILAEAKSDIARYYCTGMFNKETYNAINGALNVSHTQHITIQQYLADMDQKYNMNSREIFPELYPNE